MLVLKLWYLLFFAAASCLYPFLNLIFRRVGLSEQQVGTIAALRPFVGFSCGALFSGIADKWRIHRTILLVSYILSTVIRLSVALASSFLVILSIILVGEIFNSPVTIIVDAAAMAACTKEGEYGRQRLWGAVGWGTFSFIAGGALHYLGTWSVFVLSGVLAAATLVPSSRLPWEPLHAKLAQKHHHTDGGEDEEEAPHQINFSHKLSTLLSCPEALLFFATVTIMGYAVGTIESFLFLFLEDLGASETLMGLTLTVTCISESIVFYYAGTIMRVLGLDGCFHLCFLAFLIRLGSYATLGHWGSVWAVLPVELLHGITFGLTWSAGTAKSALIAPPGLEATTQSAFQGLMFGLGYGIGGLVAGSIYHRLGPEAVFRVAFCIIAVGWAVTSGARVVMRMVFGREGELQVVNIGEQRRQDYVPVPDDVELAKLKSVNNE